jgi:hypothetical protein
LKPFVHHGETFAYYMWNLEHSVGKGGQNSSAVDTSYIQWYYTLAAKNVLTVPERRSIYARVKVTGVCSGQDGDPLVDSITAHQRGLNHPIIDGRVSVATGTGKIGLKAFFVLRIGARLAYMYPRLWPRLDLMPECPTTVAATSLAAIPHQAGVGPG